MNQTDINRMVDARNMSPEHKDILRKALGLGAADGRQEIQEKLDSLDEDVDNILNSYAKLTDIGTPEKFTFTLEDGSTVTKTIRVISTINQAGA